MHTQKNQDEFYLSKAMNKKELLYISPHCDVIEIHIEGSILTSSPSTNVGVKDWDDEDIY